MKTLRHNTTADTEEQAEQQIDAKQAKRTGPGGLLFRAALLLALGVFAFYGLETADRVIMSRLRGLYPDTPTKVLPPPVVTDQSPLPEGDRAGNRWIAQALVLASQRKTVVAQVAQAGTVQGRDFLTRGVYQQQGYGP